MQTYDENGNLLENPDLTLGHLEQRKRIIHHEGVQGVEEVSHLETIRTYPNGGKDMIRVIDVPGVVAVEPWDEEEYYNLYILYTEEELEQMREETEKQDDNTESLEEKIALLEEQNNMLLECVMELSEIVYA